MFYGFKQFAFYLRGKEFVVQTDHANLTFTGNNQTPITVRLKVFMQPFKFTIQQIPGIKMGLVDYLSYKYLEIDSAVVLPIDEQVYDMINNMLLRIIMAIQLKNDK